LYALAAYKIIPSVQQIFFSVSRIKFSEQALNSLHKELDLTSNIKNDDTNKNSEYLDFNKSIKLENISFAYKNDKQILRNINLLIPSNSKIGIVGTTGGGKSTLVDIIMGLLNPNSGKILIDGKILDISNSQAWKKNIGYVPQQIYLSDNSIKNNIAFGVNDEDIDLEKIKYVSKLSNIDEYIEKLPNKYDTLVGERGVRLSGGEIQRIAIARAMYRQPKILILDEATSSVDNSTEKLIINAIENQITKNLTVIHIAHRLQSLKNCEKIYILDQGEIKQEGTYKTLFENK
jgi:ABC-type multidrug transport system fused ATPase/permease subunit